MVDPDPKLRARLALQLGDASATTYADVSDAQHGLRAGRPAVVVFGPSLADPAGFAEIERLIRGRAELGGILVAAELSTALMQQALRVGVRDVLDSPTEPHLLIESAERVGRMLGSASGGPAAIAGEWERGRVLTVLSPKGGAGKSVTATNLAVALAKRSDRPVALVDADLQFGDVAVLLRLMVTHTVMDAVSASDRLDAQFLQSLLVRHEPSGLFVLPAPTEPSFAERVTGADMARIVDVLQSFCGYVVVDTPAALNDVVLTLVEHADDIVLVASMEIPCIKNVRLALQTLRLLSVPEDKLRLVLNRAGSDVKLDVAEVERTLGLKADCLVPSDVVVPQSVNKGTPVVLDAPRSGVARAFEALADRWLGAAAEAPATKARGRFGLF